MKNNYIVNNKKVINLIVKESRYSKNGILFFVLCDNSEVKARGTKIKIQCHNCDCWKEFTYDGRHEVKEYICPSCRLKGENNPFYGKKHKQDFKDRLSAKRKGKWYNGENNPMFGKPCYYKMTDEEKQKWKDNISKSIAGENNPMFGKPCYYKMTDEEKQKWKDNISLGLNNKSNEEKAIVSKKLSASLKRLQEKDPIAYSKLKAKGGIACKSKAQNYQMTKPEIRLEEFLKANNIQYDYSPIMGSGEKCFLYDFIIHRKRILIEVQGNYWHGDPTLYNDDGSNGKKKLNDILKNKIKKDELKKQFAKEKNFKLICIWESEINNGDFSKLNEIL